jgi:hypothetical protein
MSHECALCRTWGSTCGAVLIALLVACGGRSKRDPEAGALDLSPTHVSAGVGGELMVLAYGVTDLGSAIPGMYVRTSRRARA